MIPPLEDGVLPEGVHDCTFEEIESVFGRFQRTDRRIRLTAKLKDYLDDARRSGVVRSIIIDGSYTTVKEEPGDIDLLIVLKPDLPWDSMRPFEYNAVSKRMIRQAFMFDSAPAVEGTARYLEYVNLYQDVRLDADYTGRRRKGLLRVVL